MNDLSKIEYDFDVERDRRISSIVFSHAQRLANFPQNKNQLNAMFDSQYEVVRRIASQLTIPLMNHFDIDSYDKQEIHGKPKIWRQMIINTMKAFKPKNILEIGTYKGITSAYIARECSNADLQSLDIDVTLVEQSNKMFNHLEIYNAKSYSKDYRQWDLSIYDVVFKDGLHKGIANYHLLQYLHQVRDGKPTMIIFDDIRWSWEMYRYWRQMKLLPHVNVSIDFYHIGVLIFNLPKLQKENYKISVPGLLPR